MTPEAILERRSALYRALDAINAKSRDASRDRAPLVARISLRIEADDLLTQIRDCNRAYRALTRFPRSGSLQCLGGTAPLAPPSSSGTTGCRGGTPAPMGHGCPAPVAAQRPSAAEAAPIDLNGHEHNPTDDPLFFVANRKKLRVGETHVTVNHAGGINQ